MECRGLLLKSFWGDLRGTRKTFFICFECVNFLLIKDIQITNIHMFLLTAFSSGLLKFGNIKNFIKHYNSQHLY